MDTTSLYELIAKGGLGAVCVYLLSIAFPKIMESITAARNTVAEGTARIDTIEMLQAQIARLNQSFQELDIKLKTAREDFEAERTRRIEAEDLVDKLQRTTDILTSRVSQLEQQIKDLGHVPV